MKKFTINIFLFIIPLFAVCQESSNNKISNDTYVVMLSMDGFRWDYPEKANTPNLDSIEKIGVRAKASIPCFPTKTFPNHYSIATGLYPDNHGLIFNNFYATDLDKNYSIADRESVNDSSFYFGEPIWVTAEKQGVKSASYFWVGAEASHENIFPTYHYAYDESVSFEERIDGVISWLQLPEKDRPHLIMARISNISPAIWFFILACSSLSYLLRFSRWQYYLAKQGHHIPLRQHLFYYLAGFALTTTPGKAGETIRSVYLKAHGVRYMHSLATFFSERLLDVIVVSFLAITSLLGFQGYTGFVSIASVVLLLILLVIRSAYLNSLISNISEKIGFASLRKALLHVSELLKIARMLLSQQQLLFGFLIGLLAWGVQGIAFFIILQQLGFEHGMAIALGIYAISLLAGAASFIPAGIGSTETVMGLLLVASGADTATAVAAPLISRLSTLWYAVLLGLLASAYLGAKSTEAAPTTDR